MKTLTLKFLLSTKKNQKKNKPLRTILFLNEYNKKSAVRGQLTFLLHPFIEPIIITGFRATLTEIHNAVEL